MANNKSTFESGILKDVFFFYTKIQTPGKKFETEETEWTTTLAISKETADMLKKEFPKKKPTQIDNDEFKEKFKIDPPFPDQTSQYLYKLQRNTVRADGTPVDESKAPKVLFTGPDGVTRNITKRVLVGNGSKGNAYYFVSESKFGRFPKLQNILLTKLVPYERPTVDNYLEIVEDDDVDLDSLLGVEGLNKKAETLAASTAADSKPSTKASGGATVDQVFEEKEEDTPEVSEVKDEDMPW